MFAHSSECHNDNKHFVTDILPEMLSPCRDNGDGTIFQMFCKYFFPAMVGVKHFNKNKPIVVVSEIVTASHEAFIILTLVNNQEKWTQMANAGNFRGISKVPTKYTKKEDGKGGHTQKGRGWSSDAYELYADIHEHVQDQRETHREVEENLKLHWRRLKQMEDQEKPKKRKERNPELDKEIIIDCEEDLSCDERNSAGLWAIARKRVVKQEKKEEAVVKQEEEEEESSVEEEEEK